MEEILHHLHTLFRVHTQAITPHPLFNIDDRFLGAVQDLCHWNDFVKPRDHSNVDDRSLGAVQDLCHWNDFVKPRVHSNVKKRARGEAT